MYYVDLNDTDAIKPIVEEVYKKYGHIDGVVNNAGRNDNLELETTSWQDFEKSLHGNLTHYFELVHETCPYLKESKGSIVNIASKVALTGQGKTTAYAAAKGALKMLTKNIASEYGEYNIQCNGMGPGYIATAQTAPLRETQPDGSRHPFDTFICAKTPAGRWGDPEDMVGPCVFLASHASDFVNGQILYADGGILAYIGRQPK